MNDILDVRWEDHAIEPVYGGGTDKLLHTSESAGDRWLIHSLDELVTSGEYVGVITTAYEAILAVADRIEQGGIADDARKPLADVIRCLVHVALQRQSQAS